MDDSEVSAGVSAEVSGELSTGKVRAYATMNFWNVIQNQQDLTASQAFMLILMLEKWITIN